MQRVQCATTAIYSSIICLCVIYFFFLLMLISHAFRRFVYAFCHLLCASCFTQTSEHMRKRLLLGETKCTSAFLPLASACSDLHIIVTSEPCSTQQTTYAMSLFSFKPNHLFHFYISLLFPKARPAPHVFWREALGMLRMDNMNKALMQSSKYFSTGPCTHKHMAEHSNVHEHVVTPAFFPKQRRNGLW